jgi:hypothetical protein
MFVSNPEKSILEVAKAIMRESPTTNPKMALLLARYIYRNRRKYVNTIREGYSKPPFTGGLYFD